MGKCSKTTLIYTAGEQEFYNVSSGAYYDVLLFVKQNFTKINIFNPNIIQIGALPLVIVLSRNLNNKHYEIAICSTDVIIICIGDICGYRKPGYEARRF